jgi:AcrR family transcriptional regulator
MARLSTEERQLQIIDEAIKIIHEKGYHALAVRELAARVGVSEAALYRHFKNKEDIIRGILNRMWQGGVSVEQKLERLSDPKEKLDLFITSQLEYFEKYPEMTSVVFSEDIFQPSESLNRRLEQVINYRLKIVRKLLDEARNKYNIVDIDTEDLSIVILGYVRMSVLEWRRANFSYSLKERGQRLLDTLKKIIFV